MSARKRSLRILSSKTAKFEQCRTPAARDYADILNFDPDVTLFRGSPDVYVPGCATAVLKPDFLVQTTANARRLLVWVITDAAAEGSRSDEFERMRQVCSAQGYDVRVVFEHEMRQGFRLGNIQLLAAFAYEQFEGHEIARVLGIVGSWALAGGGRTVADLLLELWPQDRAAQQRWLEVILSLAYRHQIALALDEAELGPQTPIWSP